MENPELVYCEVIDSETDVQPPPLPKRRENIAASFIELNSARTFPPPIIITANSCQRSQNSSSGKTQVVLSIAAIIFAIISVVFMSLYFTAEAKSRSCECQHSLPNTSRDDMLYPRIVTNCNGSEKKSNNTNNDTGFDGNMNTSRNHTEKKCKPCVYQNCSFMTNSSKCPVGCVRNSTIRKSCADLYNKGATKDGIYTIDPDGQGEFKVRCDMTTSGGGWTLFQRRIDGSVDFYLGWKNYTEGFGNLSGEFWLGLDKIHRLSKSGQNVLRVDLEDFENETRYANYSTFSVANETDKYRLTVGGYAGDAGDSFGKQNGMMFSTKDADNDHGNRHCAVLYKGAWWYRNCHSSNLNGQYLHGKHTSYSDGVNWDTWKGEYYSLKKTEMKIRPGSF